MKGETIFNVQELAINILLNKHAIMTDISSEGYQFVHYDRQRYCDFIIVLFNIEYGKLVAGFGTSIERMH